MARRFLFAGAGLALVLFAGPRPVGAQSSGRPDGMVFLPDVPGQWRALTERPDALGFHKSTTPNPSACRHYQGIARVDDAEGTPFFMVTRSGNTPEIPGLNELLCDDSPGEKRNGNLVVFRMGSREKIVSACAAPPAQGRTRRQHGPADEDVATIYFTVVEGGLVFRGDDDPLLPKVYQHPGGMQVVGKMTGAGVRHASAGPRVLPPLRGRRPSGVPPLPGLRQGRQPVAGHVLRRQAPGGPGLQEPVRPEDENGDGLSAADGIAVTPLPDKPGEPGPRYLTGDHRRLPSGRPDLLYRSSPHAGRPGQPGPVVGIRSEGHRSEYRRRRPSVTPLPAQGTSTARSTSPAPGATPRSARRSRTATASTCTTWRATRRTAQPGEEVHITPRFNGRRITPPPQHRRRPAGQPGRGHRLPRDPRAASCSSTRPNTTTTARTGR